MTLGPRTRHELEAGPNRQHIGSGHCTWTESHRDFARRVALIAVQEERGRENAALRDDNRKLALHTAEQAKELGKLRDQLEEAQDKALRFDIDSVGIERREAEGAELVTLRAELSAAQARIAELEKREREPRRRLFAADGYCPNCGHYRNASSMSSIDNEDGTHSCQMCSAYWLEN